jgi:hypothetical protein
MGNLFDYLTWRGDLSFSQSPFNPVDNIIFCQLSYFPFGGIVPDFEAANGISIRSAAEIIKKKLSGKNSALKKAVLFKDDPALISALASTRRFGDCVLKGYVNHVDRELEKQFCALTIEPDTDKSTIAYCGTGASFVGWKEDFRMTFRDTVPAQIEAVEYLENASKTIKGDFRLCGHSKGGNLAVYAAAFCDKKIRRRITDIYSNDAPGFHKPVITSEGFKAVQQIIHSYIPQSSIVGMLFEHGTGSTVIKSSQSGLMQHDLYSWEITHNDMIHVDKITKESLFIDKTLRDWTASLDQAQHDQFIDGLFDILNASKAESFTEMTDDWFNTTIRILQSLGNLDESTKKVIDRTLKALFRTARNNIALLKPGK